jgi:hypothetical protein
LIMSILILVNGVTLQEIVFFIAIAVLLSYLSLYSKYIEIIR